MSKIFEPLVQPCLAALALTGQEASQFTKLSAKSLERAAERGEPVGRAKIGRRVVYIRDTLEVWLRSRVN